ncbi:MAG: TolC family protein [Myxococcaceae bacterium]|nr:TolC family protein [Myxococcaceae bacterium]
MSAPSPAAAVALLALAAGTAAFAQTRTAPAEAVRADAPPPFEPKIDDPMLAPAPRPARVVTSWREARELLAKNSTDLRSAEAAVERAEGRWTQALAALLPNARVSAGVAVDLLHPSVPSYAGVAAGAAGAVSALPSGTDPTTPLAAASVTLSQTVVDVGAWRGLSSASAGERSARASLADVRRRVTQGLARSIVAVVAAERAAEINRISLRQALERAALSDRTFELGAGTQVDVVRVRQDVTVARSALIAGDEQLHRTREALGLALGIDEEVGVSPSFALEPLIDEVKAECRPLEDPSRRADVVAAEEQVKAAAASREQATAGYLPTLGLTSTALGFTTSPGPGQVGTWNIAAVLSVPLWEGGLRGGLVEERRGAEVQAQQAALEARRAVTVEAARAERNEASVRALLATARESRELAARLDALTRRSFQIGRATSLDLVQAAAVLRQAELNLALREFEWVQARLDALLTVSECSS